MMTQGSQTIAVSSVTMNVLLCRVSMATSGMTTMVRELPTSLMLSPVQNRRKFRCRNSPPRRPVICGSCSPMHRSHRLILGCSRSGRQSHFLGACPAACTSVRLVAAISG